MIKNTVLGVILARAGSKRLPGKNKESITGTKLIDCVLKKVQDAGIDTVAICTDYKSLNNKPIQGCEIIHVPRPPELSVDDVSSEAVIGYVLQYVDAEGYNFEYFCLLQLTAPLFNPQKLKSVLEGELGVGCASITPAYKPSGNFYVVRIADFLATGNNLWPTGMTMRMLPWCECIDIDEIYDLRIAQASAAHKISGVVG